jgi:serine/threonine protein phosphatase 1
MTIIQKSVGHQDYFVPDDVRVIYCGDIHGEIDTLLSALNEIGFDRNKDLLVATGDLIDRGSKSEDTLEFFGTADKRRFASVLGNHEVFLRDCRGFSDFKNWFLNGGDWSIQCSPTTMEQLRRYVNELPYGISVNHRGTWVGVCHAGLPVEITDWDDAMYLVASKNRAMLDEIVWGREIIDCPEWYTKPEYRVTGVDWTVHGHTPVEEPVQIGNRLYIDTGLVYDSGYLTLLEFVDGHPTYRKFSK